jgi:hypothetical protein
MAAGEPLAAVAQRRKEEAEGLDLLLAQTQKAAADPKKRELDKAPVEEKTKAAAAPRAPQAPPRPEDESRRKQASVVVVDAELAKAWYQNLHALEQCKFSKEEFDTLQKSLRGQFQAGPVDAAGWKRGVENFKDGIDRLRDARLKNAAPGAQAATVEFVCPGCQAVSPEFGRCPACDQYLILRIRIAGAEKKE